MHVARTLILGHVERERMRARKRIGAPLFLIDVRILDAVLNGDPIVLPVVQLIAGEEGQPFDERLQILFENPTLHGNDLSTRAAGHQPSKRSAASVQLITHALVVWYLTILQQCLRTWYDSRLR